MKLAALLALGALAVCAAAQRNIPRTYDLKDVSWSVVLNDKDHSIQGDVTNTLTPLKPIGEVRFDCARLSVDKVTVNGETALFNTSGDGLFVKLIGSKQPGDKLAVRILYHGTPQAGIYFVPAERAFPAHTPVVYTQGEMEDTRYWLPTYDFPDDKATSEGRIDVPKGWQALSNGKLLETTNTETRTVYHWKTDQPHSTYLISLVAGPYTEVKDSDREMPVSYWVPVGLEDQGKAAFGGTDSLIQVYENLTGYKYPFAKFAQSAVPDFMFGGMENVSAVTQTIYALHPANVDQLESSESLVAHELAHQWFGDTVTTPDWAHIWINEGFATFMPPFISRARRGDDDFAVDRMNILNGAFDAMQRENQPMVWNRYTDAIERFGGNSYEGGAARLFMLMHLVGEEPFWKGVHAFLEKYQWQNATTEDFYATMSQSTGQDLDAFRKQWYYQAAVPTVIVKRDANGFVISQDSAKFTLPIEYLVTGGTLQKATLGGTPINVPAPADARILVDPYCWLLAKIRYDLVLDDGGWMQTLRLAPIAAERLRILPTALAAISSAKKLELLKGETNVQVRTAILRSLSDVPTLLASLQDPDSRIRLAAIETLGNIPKDPSAINPLTQIATSQENDVIRLAAYKSLAHQTDDASWVAKAYQIVGYQDRFRTWAIGWYADHQRDRARDLALEEIAHPTTEELRKAAIRALGKVKDKPGEHVAFNTLTKVVLEDSVGGVRAAIQALQDYGDPAAVPFLKKQATNGLHFIRNDAKGAIAALPH